MFVSIFNNTIRSQKIPYFFLIFLVGVSTTVSLYFFLPESLRLDESQSMIQANRPYFGMLESVARDVHMPLYGTLLHGWLALFGNSITTNRILSLSFYLASICMVFVFTWEFTHKQKIAIYVSTMFTLSPFLNWFGSELRMYSMFIFLTLCLHYLFFKIFCRNLGTWYHWLLYLICLILGVFTHYLFLLFIFCQVFFLAFNYQLLSGKKSGYFWEV